MPDQPTTAIIAGVNKAGTTSLFVSLSTHPDVAPAAIKETRYFLPARYGKPLEPFSVYQELFRDAGERPVHLEATPAYVYGGRHVAEAIAGQLPGARIVMILREPVARAISFFEYQKVRLRLPPQLSLRDYLEQADALDADDFLDPTNERYLAVRGGYYADFLPGWLEVFGPDALRIVFFDDLVAHPHVVLRDLAVWLGLDPTAFPADALASENRTTGYKSKALQRMALLGNDRLERFLRRHPALKRRIRTIYYRLNGRSQRSDVPEDVRRGLTARFDEPNARLADLLAPLGLALPPWCRPQTIESTAAGSERATESSAATPDRSSQTT